MGTVPDSTEEKLNRSARERAREKQPSRKGEEMRD
jgi:hypothetical protein